MFNDEKISVIIDTDCNNTGNFFLNEFSYRNGLSLTVAKTEDWGDIIPLGSLASPVGLDYPIDCFPRVIREAIEAIAEYVQSPIAMTAQCVLGTISHIAQRRVNAPNFYNIDGEPCALFLLTEGQSGSRKSTSKRLADYALIEYERKRYDEYQNNFQEWSHALASCAKKEQKTFLAETNQPQDSSSLFSDITLEALLSLYIDGLITDASISSDEAAQFFGGYTMKSDTRNLALASFAKLFDDGSVERTRSKSNLNGSGRAHDVRLTFNMQGQREILIGALKDPVLRGQGFLARFILTVPENLAGRRLQNEERHTKDANSDCRLIAYWERCKFLLNDSIDQRYVILLDDEAKKVDLAFYNEMEILQGKGESYEYLQAFASRASQLSRRLATVLAYFEGEAFINKQILSVACDVIRFSLNEWLRYTEIEIDKESDAEKLIKNLIGKCKKQKTNLILKTLALKGAPSHLRKVKYFDEVLMELVQSNYVCLTTINKSVYIKLNPLLL
ncbi:DUF3987 domain-containing protein [Acinetobacter sp. NIPH 1869]|uniref:DUF3987 domain-containing protein n=1 Tax=Acinetobacter higginsii TaxID=70347 RepID=UPI001F4B9260|nr:DUF3987 domain-containing protein [Acinetobacter higginsii]MCH7306323.1 DUF3987 domain-containing protein [Acinetobacter higginsii]